MAFAVDLAGNRVRALATSIEESLHRTIGEEADPNRRKALLSLRRRLASGKSISDDEVQFSARMLSESQISLLSEYVLARCDGAETLAKYQSSYQQCAELSRQELQRALRRSTFAMGIGLASESTLQGLRHYVAIDPRRVRSRDRQIERGLLRYLLRASSKATPFGQFCVVVPGQFVAAGSESDSKVRLLGAVGRLRTSVRLNKALLSLLWPRMLTVPAIRDATPVRIAAGLRREESALTFLSRRGTQEVIRRVQFSAILEVVLQVIASAASDERRYGDVVQRLLSHEALDVTEADTRHFLDGLVGIGLLQFQTAISDHEESWSGILCERLAVVDDPAASAVVNLLHSLDAMRVQFAEKCEYARNSIVSEARQLITTCLSGFNVPGAPSVKMPFYEDASADARVEVPMSASMLAATRAIADLLSVTRELAWPRDEQAAMRHYFERQYGEEKTGVPLLQFYEDFHRDHLKDHIVRMQERNVVKRSESNADIGNPFGLEIVKQRRAASIAFEQLLLQRVLSNPGAEEIEISHGDLQSAFALLEHAAPLERSLSMFCHIVSRSPGAEEWRIVLAKPSAFTGYGKYYSRFLHLLPNSVRADLIGPARMGNGARLAELGLSADFNANMHPKMTSAEIAYPTEASDIAAPLRIECDEIAVQRDPQNQHRLALLHVPSGERVWPVDLGFLNPAMRPALFQLLSRFQPAAALSLPTLGWLNVTNADVTRSVAGGLTGPEVIYLPRITYMSAVVLRRRSWSVALLALQAPTPEEEDSVAFARLNRWRRDVGLPRRTFLRIVRPQARESNAAADRSDSNESAQQPKARMGRTTHDGSKPQFIDFDNPLLVQLLAATARAAPDFIASFEECLPDLSEGLETEDSMRAWEVVLQLNPQ